MFLSQNSLNGQHLYVIWPLWQGNPKGLTGPAKGGVILEYLSARFNFTFDMVRVTENWLEPTQNGRQGLFNYLWDHKADLIVQGVLPSHQRLQIVDVTSPWLFTSYAFLIPVSDDKVNINAVIKPFQWQVWLSMAVAIICVIFTLNKLQHDLLNQSKRRNDHKERYIKETNQYLYVIRNLLSQGCPVASNRLSFRLAAGVWALAAFIFVQVYTSTLYTYVVTPVRPPLIDSIYDILENQDIKLFLRSGSTLDQLTADANAEGIFKKIREKINSFPNSRCDRIADCISFVTPGTKNTFANADVYQLDTIKADFDRTRKCNFQLAKEYFLQSVGGFALPKSCRFTKTISQG